MPFARKRNIEGSVLGVPWVRWLDGSYHLLSVYIIVSIRLYDYIV